MSPFNPGSLFRCSKSKCSIRNIYFIFISLYTHIDSLVETYWTLVSDGSIISWAFFIFRSVCRTLAGPFVVELFIVDRINEMKRESLIWYGTLPQTKELILWVQYWWNECLTRVKQKSNKTYLAKIFGTSWIWLIWKLTIPFVSIFSTIILYPSWPSWLSIISVSSFQKDAS